MKEHQKVLLDLIAKSQFLGVDEPQEITLNKVDWDSLYQEAQGQAVFGIIASEIPDAVYSSDERWRKIRENQLAHNLRYFHSQNELTKLLENFGISFVVLKGTAAAVYYTHPERRIMGDIDFLVSQDQFEEAKQLLIHNGYIVTDQKEFDPNEARHIGFQKNKLSYELHHHYSHVDIDMEDYVVEGLKQREFSAIDTCRFPMLPKLSNGLVLLDHMKNHLQSGLGLRQVIDWMMYAYRELSDEYWNSEFAPVARSIGLERFAIYATRMCQLYLGLPETITWCQGADDKVCSDLLEIIFVSGNFGKKTGSGNLIESVITNIRKTGMIRWLQKAGEHNWEAYKKHPSLKPFCWIYQIFRYAKKGFATKRNVDQLSGDLERSRRRYKLMEEMGLFENQ